MYIKTYVYKLKMYTATLSPNVPPGVRSRGGRGVPSRIVKINANIQLEWVG